MVTREMGSVALGGVAAVALSTYRRASRDRASATRLDALVAASTDAIVSTDPAGRVVTFNAGAERLLGHAARAVAGRPVEVLFDADELDARVRELGAGSRLEAIAGEALDGRVERREWCWRTAAGEPLPLVVTTTPMRDRRGRPLGYRVHGVDLRPEREADERRRASELRLRLLVDALPDAIVALWDRDLRCVMAQGTLLREQGYDRSLLGRPIAEVLDPEHHERLLPHYEAALRGTPWHGEHVSGRTGRIFEVDLYPYAPVPGDVEGVYVLMRDVTVRRAAELHARRSDADLRTVIETAPVGLAVLGAGGRLQTANPALAELLGRSREALLAAEPASLVDPADLPRLRRLIADLRAGRVRRGGAEVRCLRASGEVVVLDVHAAELAAADGDGRRRVLVQAVDVTERRRFEAQLRHMADHDALTGLPNRRAFERELERHVGQAAARGSELAVAVLDIDGFKTVNDTRGHQAGDRLVVAVGEALQGRLRASDLLARLGGDEFAVVLPRTGRAEAGRVAAQLVAAVAEHGAVDVPGLHVTVSAGVAVSDGRAEVTGEGLLVEADTALYEAKDAGRARHVVFAPRADAREQASARVAWADRVTRALREDGFALVAQPIRDLRTGAVCHHELLLRMLAPDGGHVLPASFLHVAERSGLVVDVDRWVVRRAVALLAALRAAGRDDHRLQVNVSGRSLGSDRLPADVQAAIREAGVDAGDLVIEVTETAAIADLPAARRFAGRLRDLGCRLALDDFGTGFGSFSYLKHLPSDYLKIDQEFVRGCATDPVDQLVMRSIVDVAEGTGKATIAEGVEDEEALLVARRTGVDLAQGHLIGHPLPLGEAFPDVEPDVR